MRKWYVALLTIVALALLVLCSGCNTQEKAKAPQARETPETSQQETSEAAASQDDAREGTGNAEAPDDNGISDSAEQPPAGDADPTADDPEQGEKEPYCIAIDAGHQRKGNSEAEPIGPGASETKAKVSSGTTGRWTNIPEYELNLAVSLMLRHELEQRSYRVVMIRTTNDVDISNAERAKIAADAGADILVRIHANGSTDASVSGALTMCMTKNNPYCASLYAQSRRLSEDILNGLVASTGANNCGIMEVDNMTGINWATMPVTIVEMGFMTNEQEDRLMATEEYREKLARGIADGIDRYFGQSPAQPDEEADGLQAILDNFVQGKSESWDIRVESLPTGVSAEAHINLSAEHGSISASIIKIFVAGAVYEDIEAGIISHDDVIDDLKLMIQKSDNDATNRLTRKLGSGDAEAGMARVTAFASGIGCSDTQHNRLMLDFNGKENYTTARDCAIALRMIYEGQYVTAEWSSELLDIMKGQEDHTRIPRLLPEGTVVAHKTGALFEHSNGDVGIVFSPKGDYIICIISNEFQSTEVIKDNIAKLSLEVYNWFQNR